MTRALELFPNDPDVLFFAASAHEAFAGVRTQARHAIDESAEGRDALTCRTRTPSCAAPSSCTSAPSSEIRTIVEARIRLGRVLGLRGRHEEAVDQLRQGQVGRVSRCCRYYAHLFLGAEFEALGNGAEARQSYEQAAAVAPTAQSPLLGLSRVADQAGDRAAAREADRARARAAGRRCGTS